MPTHSGSPDSLQLMDFESWVSNKSDIDANPRLIVKPAESDSAADIEIGVWEDASDSARGAAVGLDWPTVNALHAHLGRLLLQAGHTVRSPGAVPTVTDVDASLREAHALLHKAWDVIRRPNPPERIDVALQVAGYLLDFSKRA